MTLFGKTPTPPPAVAPAPARSPSGHDLRPLGAERKAELARGLNSEERRVLLEHGTERAFCGHFNDNNNRRSTSGHEWSKPRHDDNDHGCTCANDVGAKFITRPNQFIRWSNRCGNSISF